MMPFVNAPAVVHVSPHLLADVVSCKTKAWGRHIAGYTSKGDAIKAKAGQAFHSAVAEALTDRLYDVAADVRPRALKAFHDCYDATWQRLAAELLEPSLTPQNLHRLVDRWIEMHPPWLLPWTRVLSVEEAFVSREWWFDRATGATVESFSGAAPATDFTPSALTIRVKLIVRPDFIVEDKATNVRFVDTKTTGWRISAANWRNELRMSLQLGLYTDAVIQRYGARAVVGGWINAVELRQLPGATDAPVKLKKDGTPAAAPKCKDHGTAYAVCGNEHAKIEIIECMTSEALVAQAVRDAESYARDFLALYDVAADAEEVTLPMEGRANRSCGFCANFTWCEVGRRPATLDSLLLHEPWPIEEGHRA